MELRNLHLLRMQHLELTYYVVMAQFLLVQDWFKSILGDQMN